MPAGFAQNAVEISGKAWVEHLIDRVSDDRITVEAHHRLKRRVAANDASVFVNRKQADVDRFDDRLVEFLEDRKLVRVPLLLFVKSAVLDSDSHVAGDRLKNFEVFAREQRTVVCSA